MTAAHDIPTNITRVKAASLASKAEREALRARKAGSGPLAAALTTRANILRNIAQDARDRGFAPHQPITPLSAAERREAERKAATVRHTSAAFIARLMRA